MRLTKFDVYGEEIEVAPLLASIRNEVQLSFPNQTDHDFFTTPFLDALRAIEHLMSKLLGYEHLAERFRRLHGEHDLEGRVNELAKLFQQHNPYLPQSGVLDEETLHAIIRRARDVITNPAVLLDGRWVNLQADPVRRSEFESLFAKATTAFSV